VLLALASSYFLWAAAVEISTGLGKVGGFYKEFSCLCDLWGGVTM